MLKSKIHRATVTATDPDYEGSAGIDASLLSAADILPYEQVHVLDITNGQRFETYAIPERAGSGAINIYGAAARLVAPGDLVIILAYHLVPDDALCRSTPRIVFVDAANSPISPPASGTPANGA